MSPLVSCLVLLTLVGCSAVFARLLKVPLPFVQIAFGTVAALPPFHWRVALEPQVFLLLFIPPLLFADGWTMPRRELFAMRWPVLGHAVGLVFFTVGVGGYALHWLVPVMPLSVAFAVAALVSPTDAVAVSAITERVKVPRHLRHLLESEALLNDASGLVAMQFAVAATMSGSFNPSSAAVDFVVVAAGGIAVGGLLAFGYALLHRRLLSSQGDATVQTVFTGLLPFAAYGIAEAVQVSGILAAVAAGFVASAMSLLERAHFSGRLQLNYTWRVVGFCLNGVVFILLGLQLPEIVGSGPDGVDLISNEDRFTVLGDVVALMALLIVLRLAWVLMSLLLGRATGRLHHKQGWRVVLASSLAGVRGTVTLAGVLSLPLLLPGGAPFPARDLAVTFATGVILLSMLIASIALPSVLRRAAADDDAVMQETRAARIAAAEAAIRTIVTQADAVDTHSEALVAFYRTRLASLSSGLNTTETSEDLAWRQLQVSALHAERDAVQAMRVTSQIDDGAARQLLSELDLLEATLGQHSHRFTGAPRS